MSIRSRNHMSIFSLLPFVPFSFVAHFPVIPEKFIYVKAFSSITDLHKMYVLVYNNNHIRLSVWSISHIILWMRWKCFCWWVLLCWGYSEVENFTRVLQQLSFLTKVELTTMIPAILVKITHLKTSLSSKSFHGSHIESLVYKYCWMHTNAKRITHWE